MTIPEGDQALAAWAEVKGLSKLWRQDPDAIRKGAKAATGFIDRLDRGHVAADEPAHAFQAGRHGGGDE
jgi:hypothetical protein